MRYISWPRGSQNIAPRGYLLCSIVVFGLYILLLVTRYCNLFLRITYIVIVISVVIVKSVIIVITVVIVISVIIMYQ